MKTYKSIDIGLQALIIVAMILSYAFSSAAILYGVFILGFVQLISMLVHLPVKQVWKSKLRKIYHWCLLLPVVGFVYALNQDGEDKYNMAGMETMLYVLIFSLLLAIFYLTICVIEFKKLKKPV